MHHRVCQISQPIYIELWPFVQVHLLSQWFIHKNGYFPNTTCLTYPENRVMAGKQRKLTVNLYMELDLHDLFSSLANNPFMSQ